jgi:predicted GIY-YIG superfamily endonuclease
MSWVYILGTDSGKYYVGSTDNIETRLAHHLHGSTPSTKRLRAKSLLLKQEYATLKEARFVERRIKN